MIKESTEKIKNGKDLSKKEMKIIFDEIMKGSINTNELANFLKVLTEKGETINEIVGATESMHSFVSNVNPLVNSDLLDIVGTGGDKKNSINVSSAAAIVCAAAGCQVAKHGNRSVSSKSGSADVLEKLGVNINLSNEKNTKLIEKIGIAFLFAKTHHPAMKYAIEARKQLGIRTIFNIIGPLTNPAHAKTMLLGVYDSELAKKLAGVLSKMNMKKVLVVHGKDGFDEISICDSTIVYEIEGNKIKEYELSPENFNIKKCSEEEVCVEDSEDSAKKIEQVFNGISSCYRNVIILNSGAGIYANGLTKSISEGIELAKKTIDTGKAKEKLKLLALESNK